MDLTLTENFSAEASVSELTLFAALETSGNTNVENIPKKYISRTEKLKYVETLFKFFILSPALYVCLICSSKEDDWI